MNDSNQLPPTPAPAATLILYRQKNQQLQIYLLKRSAKSGFMAGKYVFPGGMVDPEDGDVDYWIDHLDVNQAQLSPRLSHGISFHYILPYCVAAIRETFEEAGVLLMAAGPRIDRTYKALDSCRSDGKLGQNWLKQGATSKNHVLSVSRLFCWSHWMTPKRMKRRFDTRFFIAAMPNGQVCRADEAETTHGIWVTPEEGLAGNLEGDLPLSPPTLVTLHQLLTFPTMELLEAEIARRTWGEMIMPRLASIKGGTMIVEPWDPHYGEDTLRIDPDALAKRCLPVGKPFSRLWYHRDIWRPVSQDVSVL